MEGMDIFYNTRCLASIAGELFCTVFKDKFVFLWNMKHSLTLDFITKRVLRHSEGSQYDFVGLRLLTILTD